MTFDPYKLIKYHLYLLQLENYELGRFWKLLFKRGWFGANLEQRKNLVWTKKAVLLFILSELLILFCAAFLFYKGFYAPFSFWWQKAATFLVVVYILDFFTPLFLSVSVLLLWPFDFVAKQIIVARAKSKIRRLSIGMDSGHFSRLDNGSGVKNSGMTRGGGLKIIGIAGSYGKTTMKEVLGAVLSTQYSVLSTPDSVNTPVGISRWILNSVNHDCEILIVEMGEHYRGDVKELCAITKPDFAVVTGINEAHLERMKSLENVTATIFEIVSKAKAGAAIVLNGDDENVMGHYKEFVWPDHKIETFKIEDLKFRVFNTEKLAWEAEFEGVGKVDVTLLGEYALADISAAVKIAQSLGVSPEEIKQGISKIKPVEHRLQAIRSANNILVIDDSYNGNPAGVTEAIKVLKSFGGRRKLFITPGLVEMGSASADVHRAIGRQLAEVADVVILIKNSVTLYIEEGIKSGNQLSAVSCQLIWFDTTQAAHAALGKILQPNDVILFQNDWGDNYL